MDFTVKTDKFEGPLDLLLELITKRKFFVNDVSLAAVTDDFIQYIEDPELQQAEYGAGHLGKMAEFIVVASTLMLIKSRSLLPVLQLTEEEEESIHDLEERLVLYGKTKELSEILRKRFGKKMIFEKMPNKNLPIIFSPDSKTDTENLLVALRQVIDSLPKKEVMTKAVVKKMMNLEEAIEKLAERISRSSRLNFREWTGQEFSASGPLTHENKVAIIVGFLAMLELVKRGAIRVTQEARGDIEIETETVGVPTYG
ncbi:MAG: segregation/condensation protein A [bacterium]|nr:segregation/condensation protein A [bacterium]